MVLHTASRDALSPACLQDFRALLNNAFDGNFTHDDWDHAIGDIHVWVTGAPGLISHGSLVERTLVCSGETLRVGYVEAVATTASHRRRGYGTKVMRRIGELIRESYPMAALSTGTHAFYETLGWERWRGPTFVDSPDGRARTPGDDGDVMILPTRRSPHLDLDGDIVCDWRSGDVW